MMRKEIFAGLRKTVLALGMTSALLLMAHATFAAEAKKVATVDIPPAPALYAAEPVPLTVTQCGQCHTGAFRNIKNDGVKHTFDCQKCHTTFHAFNPRKGGWDALMPKCSSCHAAPHGKAITDCLGCHANPHAPKKIAMDARLINACPSCHTEPQQQLVQFPSKHSKLGCQKCHTSHGFKPSCFTCHKPHTEGQALSTCTTCHPVHKPKQVFYGKDVPPATCGACHTEVFAKWQKTPSRHGKVSCAACHKEKHRYVPKCSECHPKIHNPSFLQRYPNCLTCHLDVHDPPAGMGKKPQQ
jgi:hypothetical protein